MFQQLVAVALVATLLGAPAAALASPSDGGVDWSAPHPEEETPAASLVAILPNPTAPGDRGEYVVVRFDGRTNLAGWSLADDEGSAALPDRTVSGTVAFTAHPGAVPAGVADQTVAVTGFPALANGGETVVLRRNGVRIDAETYRNAPSGARWDGTRWIAPGETDFAPARSGPTTVRAFVTPDSAVPLDALDRANDRIWLAGYTFASHRAADALLAAHERGVSVRVLVDADPVGGTTARQVAVLDRLADAGIEVRVLGGEEARYDFHHAKYAVADERALVLTENWKPSGSGGHANRGWGVAVRGDTVAALEAVFDADWQARDASSWEDHRSSIDPVSGDVATGSYRQTIPPETVPVDDVTVLVAPDNAERSLRTLVAGAETSVSIEQMAVGSVETPLMRAAISAARNGSRVRVLLSRAWYVESENGRVVRRLNALAEREGLDLRAKLVTPGDRFEKLHAKGVVVDGRHVVVGSVNWNRHSLRENREVAVVLTGEAVGTYYDAAFDADWQAEEPDAPVPGVLLGAAVVSAAGVGVLFRRQVSFETGNEPVNTRGRL
ncbi:phospholipase D-like domain-containing protein [Haloarchaeobius sp. TZWWS8]|uniref:phospholipase D-like domain-containing protein n=1 Tax=Haloarchaeobius sp. TZWWS8 TaxID=3446121 RepID=UPI003EBB42D8